jgi:hypothetical protein
LDKNRAVASSYVLLMRHGAGIKVSHDPLTTPPGPDHILTAQGFRDAQAVGQRLAETLTSTVGGGGVAWIRYAGAAGQSDRWALAPGANREPEATAKVMARQLAAGGVACSEPEPWPEIRPESFPASSEQAATKAQAAANCLETEAKRHPGQAVLVVGNSPQVDWIAEQLAGRPIAIGRGEVVCLAGPYKRWRWPHRPWRSLWELQWTVAPSEQDTIKDLRDKIRSKMETAKFLGTFVTALVSFVLGKRLDALKAAVSPTQPIPIPLIQDRLWLATVLLLAVAAVLCFAALFYYDGLLMPERYWTSPARRASYGRNLWMSPWHESAAYLPP